VRARLSLEALLFGGGASLRGKKEISASCTDKQLTQLEQHWPRV